MIGAVLVASLLRGFIGQMFVIPSESMAQTLQINDRVAVLKVGSLQRGQIVVFTDPGQWLVGDQPAERNAFGRALEFVGVLPDTGTHHLIKRLVGLPGDHVVCCDGAGQVTVNGFVLDERAYLYTAAGGAQAAPSTIPFDVTVPTNRIFVLGDNREHSRDSRCHLNDGDGVGPRGENAFVPLDLVVGHAVAVAWPLADAEWMRVPATFADVPPPDRGAPSRAIIEAGPEANC